jgi:hypothetical protein
VNAANVKSIEAIRQFRAELRTFEDSVRQTLDILSAELKRALDYFESDRATYWPAQVRRASDRLAEARINLERCQVTTKPGEGPSCYEEKKALQRAKLRLQTAEQRVKATRKWVRVVRQEVEEFQTRLSQITYLTDTELPHANALLARMAARLDRYTQRPDTVVSPFGDNT